VFDYGNEDSFVSESFVQSLKNISLKRAALPKTWRDGSGNEYFAYTGFKAWIRMGQTRKKLEDQTLYILSVEMSQSVILGSKIESRLTSKGAINRAANQNEYPRKMSSQHKTMSLPVRPISSTIAPAPDVPLYNAQTSYTPADFTSTESTQIKPTLSRREGNDSQINNSSPSGYTPPHQSYARSDYTNPAEENSSNYHQGTATSGVAWTEGNRDSGSANNYPVSSGAMSSYSSAQPQDSMQSWPSTPPYTDNLGQGYYQPQQYKYQEL
jgi:hypothetical protein